jgi:flagellar assembly protein FliH
MSNIIRATDRNATSQTVAFNFADMSGEANRYLEKVRGEAAAIVAQARREAAAVRQQAEREGRQAAMQSVEQVVRQQLATVLPALRQAIEDIGHAKQAWLRHWEASGVHVAAAIAQKVIRRELLRQPEIPVALIREALELASGSARLRLRLNPEDHKRIAGQVDLLVTELAKLAEAEVVPDPEITPGGCRVETRFGVIDQQFETQLKRIEEELVT